MIFTCIVCEHKFYYLDFDCDERMCDDCMETE